MTLLERLKSIVIAREVMAKTSVSMIESDTFLTEILQKTCEYVEKLETELKRTKAQLYHYQDKERKWI